MTLLFMYIHSPIPYYLHRRRNLPYQSLPESSFTIDSSLDSSIPSLVVTHTRPVSLSFTFPGLHLYPNLTGSWTFFPWHTVRLVHSFRLSLQGLESRINWDNWYPSHGKNKIYSFVLLSLTPRPLATPSNCIFRCCWRPSFWREGKLRWRVLNEQPGSSCFLDPGWSLSTRRHLRPFTLSFSVYLLLISLGGCPGRNLLRLSHFHLPLSDCVPVQDSEPFPPSFVSSSIFLREKTEIISKQGVHCVQ